MELLLKSTGLGLRLPPLPWGYQAGCTNYLLDPAVRPWMIWWLLRPWRQCPLGLIAVGDKSQTQRSSICALFLKLGFCPLGGGCIGRSLRHHHAWGVFQVLCSSNQFYKLLEFQWSLVPSLTCRCYSFPCLRSFPSFAVLQVSGIPTMFGSKFDSSLLSNSFPCLRSFPSFAFFKSVLQVSGIPMMFGSKFNSSLLSNSFLRLRGFPSFAFFKSVLQASGLSCSLLPCIKSGYLLSPIFLREICSSLLCELSAKNLFIDK